MSSESIERFKTCYPNVAEIEFDRDEKVMRVSDHQRIVKELEARWKEHEAAMLTSMTAQGKWIERLQSALSLSDAIREVERMRAEYNVLRVRAHGEGEPNASEAEGKFSAADDILSRLKSLGTQEGVVGG